ncbi:sensor histidine kinase [Vagococcus allomyrinae]|nr:GHKL domain-containing protein [Vagococcus allomyrinae]
MNEIIVNSPAICCLGLMIYVSFESVITKPKIVAGLLFFFLISLVSIFVDIKVALVIFAVVLGVGIIRKKRSVFYLILLISLILATVFSITNSQYLEATLLGGGVVCHSYKIRQQITPLILVGICLFEGVLLFLFMTANSIWLADISLLMTFLLILIIDQLLRYLFQETDMIFARSLDQIMANYIGEVDSLYQNIRGWRHDYHNHLQAMKVYLEEGKLVDIANYLAKLEDKLLEVDQIVKSGNSMLDAIVNSKLSIATDRDIRTTVKVFVGKQPLINDIDLCVILGNILDNAIEANEEIENPDKRMLRVYISILKQQLYISVTNSRPLNQTIDNSYTSTKSDKRGLGIRRIDQLVSKYDGLINRQFEEEVFVTEIILPLMTISER